MVSKPNFYSTICFIQILLVCIRHHNAFYVLGAPNNPEDGSYKKHMEIHEKYKARYEGIKWMMEGLEDGPLMYDWGRR